MNSKFQTDYSLLPQMYKTIEAEYDGIFGYTNLHQVAVEKSNIKRDSQYQMANNQHIAYYQSLDEQGIDRAYALLDENPTLRFNDDVRELLRSVLTPEVDREIKNYFGSHYAIMFYSSRNITIDSRETNPSTRWHCDGAPTKSAMVMCYLNGEDDHHSSTLFLDNKTTNTLKELGYIYCRVCDRHEHIDDLLTENGIDSEIHRHDFKPGETIIFGASQVAHRAEIPKEGTTRTTIDICLIPSPVPWDEAIDKGFTPRNECVHYKGQSNRLLKVVNEYTEPSTSKQSDPSDHLESIVITGRGGITSEASLKLHLESIFKDKHYANGLFQRILLNPVDYHSLTVNELILLLKKSFSDGLNWGGAFNAIDLRNLGDLIEYEQRYLDSSTRFVTTNKPNPEAVMWPIPNHAKYPKSKFNMLPYVKTHKIMSKDTPIGSAGSCFAMEIAKVLQKEGFNYVISELGENPQEEAIIDGYQLGSKRALYSSNFGILFNTPSLRQIAEKAFGEREFTRYLVEAENGLYLDPYRENVYFKSQENYQRDYPKHVAAIQHTLMNSEVFVFTAGLNECWELVDGTVISRNPRNGFFHLMKHRVLTVEENVNNIISFFDMVKKRNPKFKLVLTLSPIPLLATGRADEYHILEANTHSKAVLRVALDEVVKYHEDIFYLPSYELVTECMPSAWKEDHRHVTDETVGKVIGMFKEMFVKTV